MDPMEQFDFWYAVNNTEIIKAPVKTLETFGATFIRYRMISQLMDSLDIRVREGRLEAARPQIITPSDLGNIPLEGFNSDEAEDYVSWIKQNAQHLRLMQYGFTIKKRDVKSYTVSDSYEQVMDNVLMEHENKDDPLAAVIAGVDKPWEVCLLKLMIDVIERSFPCNLQDFKERNVLPGGPDMLRKEIEKDFLTASRDASRIAYLHKKLEMHNLFSEYEDRFFALVRASQT